jgi:hypothetical protein
MSNVSNASRVSDSKVTESLKVCTWNAENFINFESFDLSKHPLSILKKQDIILLQETRLTKEVEAAKKRNSTGLNPKLTKFLEKLNNNDDGSVNANKYKATEINRVAVIYNSELFESQYTAPIELIHEPPKWFETTYTSGSQVTNMLTILYPVGYKRESLLSINDIEVNNSSHSQTRTNNSPDKQLHFPICVVNFHLNAYSPEYHPGFHKKQLTELLKNAVDIINGKKIRKFGLFIGGDTNYRTIGETGHLLLEELLPIKTTRKLKLRDVCETQCKRAATQSFQCVHETKTFKEFPKYVIKGMAVTANKVGSLSRNIKKLTRRQNRYNAESPKNPNYTLSDNRLDFIATNLKINYAKTRVVPVCEFSDHYMVLSSIKWEIDDDAKDHQSVRSAFSNKSPSKKQNKRRWFKTRSHARIHLRSSPSPKFSSL